jgi:hypothetical protein
MAATRPMPRRIVQDATAAGRAVFADILEEV